MSTRDYIQLFLLCVEAFFILYMVGYSSFLFLSVTVGSSELYANRRRNTLKNEAGQRLLRAVSILVPAHNEAVTIEPRCARCWRWTTSSMRSSSSTTAPPTTLRR